MNAKQLGKRLLQIVLVALGISFLTFLITYLAPGDPVRTMFAATGMMPSEELIQETREAMGLNRPVLVQYLSWLQNCLKGDFGTSYAYHKPVAALLTDRLWPTLKLSIASMFLMLLVAVPVGMAQATHKNSIVDYALRGLTFFGVSMPNFWVGLLLMLVFCVKFQLLPVASFGGDLKSLILPSVTLAFAMSAKYTRQVRTAILEELNQDYVTGARARGVKEWQILWLNVFPNSLLPLITMLGLSLGSLLGGTAVVEVIFSYPGMGSLAVAAITAYDYPLIQGYVLWISLIYMLVNLAVDISYNLCGSKNAGKEAADMKFKRFVKKNKFFCLFALLAFLILLAAVFAPVITGGADPAASVLKDALQAPNARHIFGTDKLGRDIFTRVIYGARTSLTAAFSVVILIFVLGTVLGVLAGYFGGWIDTVIMRVADMMVSFPGMVFAMAIAGILGASIRNAVIAVALVSWTKYARLARSLVLKIRNRDYVAAAVVTGSKTLYILMKYMVPNVIPTLVITAATDIGGMMLELAGLSFLGFGAKAPNPEWGLMLNEGRPFIQSAPWMMICPGAAIFIVVVVFNLLGDALRDVLDVRDE